MWARTRQGPRVERPLILRHPLRQRLQHLRMLGVFSDDEHWHHLLDPGALPIEGAEWNYIITLLPHTAIAMLIHAITLPKHALSSPYSRATRH